MVSFETKKNFFLVQASLLNTFFLSICICICILRFQGGSICICISNTYKIVLFLPFSISCTTQEKNE